MMRVDLNGKFAGGDQLRNQRAAFADIQLLRAEAPRDLFAFDVAVIIEQRGEVIVGVLIHAHFPFPLGLQQIVDGFGRLRAADLFGVEQVNHERRPDAVKITVFVVKARAQAAPLWRVVAADGASLLERV